MNSFKKKKKRIISSIKNNATCTQLTKDVDLAACQRPRGTEPPPRSGAQASARGSARLAAAWRGGGLRGPRLSRLRKADGSPHPTASSRESRELLPHAPRAAAATRCRPPPPARRPEHDADSAAAGHGRSLWSSKRRFQPCEFRAPRPSGPSARGRPRRFEGSGHGPVRHRAALSGGRAVAAGHRPSPSAGGGNWYCHLQAEIFRFLLCSETCVSAAANQAR